MSTVTSFCSPIIPQQPFENPKLVLENTLRYEAEAIPKYLSLHTQNRVLMGKQKETKCLHLQRAPGNSYNISTGLAGSFGGTSAFEILCPTGTSIESKRGKCSKGRPDLVRVPQEIGPFIYVSNDAFKNSWGHFGRCCPMPHGEHWPI